METSGARDIVIDTDGLRKRYASALSECAEKAAAGIVCSYVPRELFDAFGLPCVRLAACGARGAGSTGERLMGSEACSWCSAIVGARELATWSSLRIVVGSSTCDQMRRHVERWPRLFDTEAFVFCTPSTWQDPSCLALYRDELCCLVDRLAALTGHGLDEGALAEAIRTRNAAREKLRSLRGRVAARDFLLLIHLDFILDSESMLELLDEVDGSVPVAAARDEGSGAVRLLLAGSPLGVDDGALLATLEDELGGRVVADLTCTGDRWIAFSVETGPDLMTALGSSYFRRPPCVWRRPNDGLYDYARGLVEARRVQGVVYRTVKFCDLWSYEGRRFAEKLDLPILFLDGTAGDSRSERVATRLGAFLEGFL